MADHGKIAERLRRAYTDGAVPPLRDALRPNDIDGAYAVQEINTRHWMGTGRRVVGRKIGLTSAAVQQQLGVDQPDFGVLFSDMQIDDGGTLEPEKVLQAKAEAEIAVILGKDIASEAATPEEVLAAAEAFVAAIEIVDSRIADWKITFADTVADNGSSSHFVLGRERCRATKDVDLFTCGMVMEVDGKIASTGVGAACLGHPLKAAAWLARTLAVRGQSLRAGDIILTGALGPMVALSPGMQVKAAIGGLGAVSFNVGAA